MSEHKSTATVTQREPPPANVLEDPQDQSYSFTMWPHFGDDEIAAAVSVLRSGKVNYWGGREGREFEAEFSETVGCRHAVALANGTLALEAALRALGIGAGDEVITTCRTFIASASCAVALGARPVFADVDRESQNVTAESIRAVITPRSKAIVAVHLAGWPCEMDSILEVAGAHGLKVVEDCAQAQGATYKGRPVGSIGDAGAFSFCQDKIMTTAGEGGMVTTNNEELWNRVWSYKDHGKSYDAVYCRQHAPGFRWLHESLGTNFRLTDLQSAVGRVMLRKVPEWVAIRRRHAEALYQRLTGVRGLRLTHPPRHVAHAFYKYYAFVRSDALRPDWNRDRIMAEINARGIPCFSGSCSEIYLERGFPTEWQPQERLPVARELGETSLMFLVHPTLSDLHIERTGETIAQVMNMASA